MSRNSKTHFVFCTLFFLATIMGAWSYPVQAQKKVGVILSQSLNAYEDAFRGIQQNAHFEIVKLNLEGSLQNSAAVMTALKNADVAAIAAVGTQALKAADTGLTDIPLIYTMVVKPGEDLAHSKAGAVLMSIPIELQFKIMKRLFPDAVRFGTIYKPANSAAVIVEARALTQKMNLSLLPIAVESQAEVSQALENLTLKKMDVFWTVLDEVVIRPDTMKRLIDRALAEKVPLVGLSVFQVKAGALVAFSVDFVDMGIQTADMINRAITTGNISPAIEFPRKIVIYLNPKTRDAIGLENMPSVPNIQMVE